MHWLSEVHNEIEAKEPNRNRQRLIIWILTVTGEEEEAQKKARRNKLPFQNEANIPTVICSYALQSYTYKPGNKYEIRFMIRGRKKLLWTRYKKEQKKE